MIDPLGGESTFGFLKTAMSAASIGHQMTSANLANIDTPGYKARHMNFEDILRDYEDQKNMMPNPYKVGDRTLPPAPVLEFKDYLIEDGNNSLSERFDGNNVDLDKEMAHMAKMRGTYQLASQFMSRKIHLLNETIMSGR